MTGMLDRLSVAVLGKAVEPPFPAWCQPKVGEFEELIEVRERDASSSWAGFIRYQNAKGELSERRIVCRAVEGYGSAETINAWCCEKREHRRFRIDRISELVCLATGEVMVPQEHFDELRLRGALKVVDKALNDFGRLLVFMARCDGTFHPLEADSVEHALERYIVRFGGDDRTFEVAHRNIGKIAPDGDDFVAALTRLHQHPSARQLGRLLIDCIDQVNVADGKLHPEEMEWSQIASDVLKRMAMS